MIELKNVSKYYNNNGVVTVGLRNISLKLSRGEIVAITGESGSGKSTLLNVICGVDTYEDGEILFNGNETSYFNSADMDAFRKKYVSFIYQNYNIIESYSVLENVKMPLLIKGLSDKEATEKAKELIKKVGLEKRIHNKGSNLSGGEKQRCVIARALADDSPVLACDEPTGNLDAKTGEEIIRLIAEVAKDKLVLIVTHNYDQVKDIVTRTIRMHDGEVIEDIVKENITDTSQGTMELEENQKTSKKTLLEIAALNIKNTPKKNLFISLVMIVFSVAILFLFLFSAQTSANLSLSGSSQYNNMLQERMVIYDEERKPLDSAKLATLNGTVIENGFYEDYTTYGHTEDYYPVFTMSTYFPSSTVIKEGNAPEKDDECFLICMSEDTYNYCSDVVKIGSSFTLEQFPLKQIGLSFSHLNISGIGYIEGLKTNLLVTKYDFRDIVNGYAFMANLESADLVTSDGEISLQRYYITIDDYNNLDKARVVYKGPEEPQISELVFNLKNIYHLTITDFDLDYDYDEYYTDCYIYIPSSGFKFAETYEATLYTTDMEQAKKEVTALGYSYRVPCETVSTSVTILSVLTWLFIGLAIIAGILLTFVVYVILHRVYVTKNRDFTIMRSLGLMKRDMSHIVQLEMLYLSVLSSALAFGGMYIVSIFNSDLAETLSYNTPLISVVYFLAMIFFANIIARRFNRRLFRFTVSTSIKGEVARND